jgi:hypothetical protein
MEFLPVEEARADRLRQRRYRSNAVIARRGSRQILTCDFDEIGVALERWDLALHHLI